MKTHITDYLWLICISYKFQKGEMNQVLKSHLLVTLLTVVGICSLQQISFNILLHRVQQVLVVPDVYIECCE